MKPKVTVVLPVYNGASCVGAAIRSVIGQTWRDLELIVVNDGSTDSTPQVLREFEPFARVIHQDNSGPEMARNRAISEASGEYIAFIDADDEWFPDKLERQLPLLEANPDTALVFGDARIAPRNAPDAPGVRYFRRCPPRRGHVFEALVKANFIPQSSVVVRKRFLDEGGPFLDLPPVGDYLMWLAISMRHRVDYLDQPVYRYLMHTENISSNRRNRWAALREGFHVLATRATDARMRALLERRVFQSDLMLELIRISELLGGARQWFWAGGLIAGALYSHSRRITTNLFLR